MIRHWKLLLLIFLISTVPAFIAARPDKAEQHDEQAVVHEEHTDESSGEAKEHAALEHDEHAGHVNPNFPRPLNSYGDENVRGLGQILKGRIKQEPFNLIASLLFLLAIIHTFLTSVFAKKAHEINERHKKLVEQGLKPKGSVNVGGELLHFLGEVEAVFGIWAAVLFAVIASMYDWRTATGYFAHTVNYTEPLFVIVIMVLASSRPILKLAENILAKVANLFGGGLAVWWLTILIIAPMLGSFITEPAAMTISAMLLSQKLYELEPSTRLKYATLGLLFVNVSVGGTLTHFAAPPVLMVSGKWHWGLSFMFLHFGWKTAIGIMLSTFSYYFFLRKELATLSLKFTKIRQKEYLKRKYFTKQELHKELAEIDKQLIDLGVHKLWEEQKQKLKATIRRRIEQELDPSDNIDMSLFDEVFEEQFEEQHLKGLKEHAPGLLPPADRPVCEDPAWDLRPDPVPAWVTIVHVIFLVWTVINAHHSALFIAGMLFFIGFAMATPPYQNRLALKSPLLVGFFLSGLVIHGGLQAWWIAPILSSLESFSLMLAATILTAFNDNAAITFLSSLVPNFSPALKYAVVSGAVTGGGLTVIANAPNPAGQAILKRHFKDGIVSPAGLAKAALFPTIVMFLIFILIFG